MMLQDDRGEPPKKRIKRNYVGLQKRLKALCKDVIAGRISTEEFLRAVGQSKRRVSISEEVDELGKQ
ncbi:hypothetical protein E2C01_034689 [Portunus trituberculatus]|uniref:Uncharacterized protein n=1 Tax=Portunus trituberculatus TaxID=210409 RepID=A0A5B7F681_PORTR|nr:hypothetical protein [Portunus trituberculatus]